MISSAVLIFEERAFRNRINKQLQMKIHELEMSLETEISERFEKMEQEEINRLEDGHSQRLSEREQQLREE